MIPRAKSRFRMGLRANSRGITKGLGRSRASGFSLPGITSGSAAYEVGRVDKFNNTPDHIRLRRISAEMTRMINLMGGVQETAEYCMWYLARWCLMEIVFHTPIETGYAASMWTITPRLGSKRASFIIANGVPYILYLEYGHSTQAPVGMVRVTFFKARTYLRYIYNLLLAEVQKGARSTGRGEAVQKLTPGWETRNTPARLMIMDLRLKLEQILPLDKPIETRNASAWLAMHTEDPRQYSPGAETMISFDVKREAKSLEHAWRSIAHSTGRRHEV